MTYAKLKWALGFSLAMMLAGGATTAVHSADAAGDNLSPSDIFKRAQDKYASLTSYSDEGKTVATVNGTIITTTFTIRLGRPQFYRIEWKQDRALMKMKTQAVWSAGEGDFLQMAGREPEKQASQMMALAGATGISGGAAATVPAAFFNTNWGNQLNGSALGEKRETDEKVGDTECYVFTRELNGMKRTLWIGKQDFLIRQVRNVTSAEAMKAALAEAAKTQPDVASHSPPGGFHDVISTETHTNVVVNPKFSPTDFAR